MERFIVTRPCMYGTKSYAKGEIITKHITGEHLLALGFVEYAPEDNPADATESEPEPSRHPAANDKE